MSSELIGELGCALYKENADRTTSGPSVSVTKTPFSMGVRRADGNDKLRRVKGKSGRRIQRYRNAWEKVPEFSVWLSAHPSPYKAICDVCDKIMVADITVIRQHAVSTKHLMFEKIRFNSRQQSLSRESECLTANNELPAANVEESGTATGNEGGKQFIMYRDVEHQYSAEGTNSSAVDSYSGIYVPMPQDRAIKSEGVEREESRLFVTKPAPHWRGTAIVNGHVTRLDMNDYKGRYVVLFFYAHNFSKVDASEINRLSDRIGDFRNVHAEIVACSTDSHLSHLTWVKKSRGEGGVAGVKIPLIADPTHVISKEYGVYISNKGHCLRAHFVIDRRGILRHMAINDPLIGRGTDELLRIVKALQFSDQVEEPLVADWMPDA